MARLLARPTRKGRTMIYIPWLVGYAVLLVVLIVVTNVILNRRDDKRRNR